MTTTEETNMIALMCKDNDNTPTEKLWDAIAGLAYKIGHQQRIDRDDVPGLVFLLLPNLLEKWNPAKGDFALLCSMWFRPALQKHRCNTTAAVTYSAAALVRDYVPTVTSASDPSADGSEIGESIFGESTQSHDEMHIDNMFEILPPMPRQIMTYVLEGYNQIEIGELMNKDPRSINYHIKQSRATLRNQFYDKFIGGQ